MEMLLYFSTTLVSQGGCPCDVIGDETVVKAIVLLITHLIIRFLKTRKGRCSQGNELQKPIGTPNVQEIHIHNSTVILVGKYPQGNELQKPIGTPNVQDLHIHNSTVIVIGK